MRGFTSVVRLPLFLIVVFTISAAAQEQPENNQFNGLDYTLQKPAKNERYAKKKFGDHLFISGEAGLILDRSAGSLFATPGLGLRAGLTVGDWFSPDKRNTHQYDTYQKRNLDELIAALSIRLINGPSDNPDNEEEIKNHSAVER